MPRSALLLFSNSCKIKFWISKESTLLAEVQIVGELRSAKKYEAAVKYWQRSVYFVDN